MKTLIITIVAMLVIASLEAYALSQDINGVNLSMAIAALAGLGGYHLKNYQVKRTKK